MSRFIPLHHSVVRCRPKTGMQKLLNDCGRETGCARRMAANTNGSVEEDLSQYAMNIMGMGVFVDCQYFIDRENCEHQRDPQDIKTWRRPDA